MHAVEPHPERDLLHRTLRRAWKLLGLLSFLMVAVWILWILLGVSLANAKPVIATWYGNELRGHRTANGERFNPNGLTAAHKTLPFGSCVRVTYRGRSVNVRINDRGPYNYGASIDLAWGAAKRIGMMSTSRVNMERC